MADLFQRSQVTQRSLLIQAVAFDGINDDHGIQIIKHLRSPWCGRTPCVAQFLVAFGIFSQVRLVFSSHIRPRPAQEPACGLIRLYFSDYVCQTPLRS